MKSRHARFGESRVFVKEAYLGPDRVGSLASQVGARDRALDRALDTTFAAALDAELGMAYRLAGYMLADAAEAQDAVQEASVRAWRGWPKLRQRDRFRAWFSQILVNVCRTKLRHQARHRALDIDEVDVEGSDPFRSALARDAVGRALSCLSPELRMVVILRYWGELSLAEIAERLGIPIGTVKSRHHAALHTLRRRIGPAEGGGS
jgi:RNA polymerase sigma-70 factor (ECF subfamily)